MKFDNTVNIILQEQGINLGGGSQIPAQFNKQDIPDLEKMFAQHLGSDLNKFNSLPASEQNRKVNNLLDDYTRQTGFNDKFGGYYISDLKKHVLDRVLSPGSQNSVDYLPDLNNLNLGLVQANGHLSNWNNMDNQQRQRVKNAGVESEKYGQALNSKQQEVNKLRQEVDNLQNQYRSNRSEPIAVQLATKKEELRKKEQELKNPNLTTSQSPATTNTPQQSTTSSASQQLNTSSNPPQFVNNPDGTISIRAKTPSGAIIPNQPSQPAQQGGLVGYTSKQNAPQDIARLAQSFNQQAGDVPFSANQQPANNVQSYQQVLAGQDTRPKPSTAQQLSNKYSKWPNNSSFTATKTY